MCEQSLYWLEEKDACKATITGNGVFGRTLKYGCIFRNGYGPDGDYCQQHASAMRTKQKNNAKNQAENLDNGK